MKTAHDDDHEKEAGEGGGERQPGASSSQQASTQDARQSPVAASAGGGGGKSAVQTKNTQPQPQPFLRPFEQALQALERLTAAVGKPHDGVSAAISSSSSTTAATKIISLASSSGPSRTAGGDVTWNEQKNGKQGHLPRRSTAANAEGSGGGRRAGGGGASPSSPSGGERCRVGFDMIRLLTGPDSNDTWGRRVGVGSGEDVEVTTLGGGHSMVCAILGVNTAQKGPG